MPELGAFITIFSVQRATQNDDTQVHIVRGRMWNAGRSSPMRI